MKKVIFIMETLSNPNRFRRIDDFIAHGYDVEIYGFKRSLIWENNSYKINLLGEFTNGRNYAKRVIQILSALHSVVKKHKRDNVLYYCFGMQTAFYFFKIARAKYIYEETDMQCLYSRHIFIRAVLSKIDKSIIKNSVMTVFSSEGFSRYHFGDHPPQHVAIIANKLNPRILEYQKIDKKIDMVDFGFVGAIYYEGIYKFAKIIGENFPEKRFKFFGYFLDARKEARFNSLKKYGNVTFNGRYTNPQDLPSIYSQIDLVVSTYDTDIENTRWAEPNKLYEAIYFEKPIIVSRNTYLSEKAEKLGAGFSLDMNNTEEVVKFINDLTVDDVKEKAVNCHKIPKQDCIAYDNAAFFKKIDEKIYCLS